MPNNLINIQISNRFRLAIYIAAVMLLVYGIYASLSSRPDLLTSTRIMPILLVLLIGIPLTILVNSFRYYFSAQLICIKVPFKRAIEVTTLSTAANMLPLPGGTFVRFAALSADAKSIGLGTTATLLSTLAWASVAIIYASVAIGMQNHTSALPVFVTGMSGLIAAIILLCMLRHARAGKAGFFYILVTEIFSCTVEALRFMLCVMAFSQLATFQQSAVFVLAGLAGSAVSIVPAGLGIREAASALLGPVVNIDPEICFMAALLNRIIGLAGITPVAMVFAWNSHRSANADK